MSRISALKNKIKKLKIKTVELENTFTFKHISNLEKEIILLKQEVECKQVDIDSLVYKLYKANKELKDANENIDRYIQNAEDKKIKNRLKKFLVG